jgi:hypothetical protein
MITWICAGWERSIATRPSLQELGLDFGGWFAL